MIELETRLMLSTGSTIRTCYETILQRSPAQAEVDTWVQYGLSDDQQVGQFVSSQEFNLSHRDWLRDVYFTLLGRSVDPTGIAAWTGKDQLWVGTQIARSQEFIERQGFDPITLDDGTVVEAFGDELLLKPITVGESHQSFFPNPNGTLEEITVQDLNVPVQSYTHVKLIRASGEILDVPLPESPFGTGFEPFLAYGNGTVYLVSVGSEAGTGGLTGISVFASEDQGQSFEYRGAAATQWMAGTQIHAPELVIHSDHLELNYSIVSNIFTWTSDDSVRHNISGMYGTVSFDRGVSWQS